MAWHVRGIDKQSDFHVHFQGEEAFSVAMQDDYHRGDDMRSMICPRCAELLPDNARYCPLCGEAWQPQGVGARSAASGEQAQTQEASGTTQPLAMAHANWHKEVDPASHHAFAASRSVSTPVSGARPALSDSYVSLLSPVSCVSGPSTSLYREHPVRQFRRHFFRPSLFFWVSMLALAALVMGGLSGLAVTLGRGILSQGPPHHGTLALQVIPSSVALGAMITLHGSNFSPGARIGLFRDGGIAMADTGGQSMLVAKADGTFSDTVIVNPNWGAGQHLIQAEDSMLHKTAAFTILVSGHSASLRPAHLLLSTNSLDLGSDDQTMNSTRAVQLSNVGGGQISWQATATQPWLQFSPLSGTINEGQSVTVRVAGARSNLKIGSYTAQILFTSNAGQATLAVHMGVTALEPQHEAILQISPAVLSFTASDGATNPPAQVVTVSNPGMRPLQWSASVNARNMGQNWLTVSPVSDTIPHGQSESAIIAVNTSSLLPGSYSGTVTFTGQGADPVQDSPQNVFVSLTVLPQCALQVSPGKLSYSSVYRQQGPAAQTVNLTGSSSCTSALAWNIASAPPWLSVSASSGKTPTSLTVRVVNKGLQPGTYNGTILFNSQAGTQSLSVTYVVGKPSAPGMSITPAAMSFSAVLGQQALTAQSFTISNTGGGILNWTAAAATTVGGNWLSVQPASGSLAGQKTAAVSVAVSLPPGIIPGTYSGTITVGATDGSGQPIPGGPQAVAVTLAVNAPCAIAASPGALSFTGVVGGQPPAAQNVAITASGACAHSLNWTASVTGGNWLTTTPASGTVSLTMPATTGVSVSLSGLQAGGANATITLSATDSASGAPVGTPIIIPVTLNIQAACALQPASASNATFTTEDGVNPPAQTITVNVGGACSNNLTLASTVTQGTGTNWLAITPGTQAMTGNNQTFTITITVTSIALADGSYSGSISLSAVDGGITVLGSPQTVNVALTVLAPPTLSLTSTAGQLTFTATPPAQSVLPTATATATPSRTLTISNTGEASLNWTATLPADTPTFLSLATASGSLSGDANATIILLINPAGQASGTYRTSITIQATDPLTGEAVQGSPLTIPVTIIIPPS